MKKNNTGEKRGKTVNKKERQNGQITIGIDLGDKTSRYCVLDSAGEVIKEESIATKRKALAQR